MDVKSSTAVAAMGYHGVQLGGSSAQQPDHVREGAPDTGPGGLPKPGAAIHGRHTLGAPGNTAER